MRMLPGAPRGFANETPTTEHMSQYLIGEPAILSSVASMFDKDITAFTSLLARKNMFSGKLLDPLNPRSANYKIVGNRKVQWQVKGFPERKGTMVRDAICDEFPTQMGKKQTVIKIFLDTNWFSPRDVLELGDNRSQLFVYDTNLPEEVEAGVWQYNCKVNTNNREEYIPAELLTVDSEISMLFTQFEEMSETAYEKYTFDEKAQTHLTIQRLKWSISGSAEQYKAGAIWVEHNGVNMWTTKAEMLMLQRAALYRERQFIFGKSTVGLDDKTLVKTNEGFDIMAGDGIMNQGDGAWRFGYNELSMKIIDNMIENIALYGEGEVAIICGRKWYSDFSNLMREKAGIDPKVVEMDGTGKGINLDYNYYKINGVKLIPTVVPWFDSPMRASRTLSDGSRANSGNAIFVSLGDVEINNPAIEILALGNRSWIEGEVNGINKGGDMANSVDGMHKHCIWETGAAMKDINGIGEMYKLIA